MSKDQKHTDKKQTWKHGESVAKKMNPWFQPRYNHMNENDVVTSEAASQPS